LDSDEAFLDIDDPDVITDTTTLKISHDINQKDLIFRFFSSRLKKDRPPGLACLPFPNF
jgi:hypothetical protein